MEDSARPETPPNRRERFAETYVLIYSFAWLPAVLIVFPLLPVYAAELTRLLYLLASLFPGLLFARGVQTLLFPESRLQRPWSVLSGSLAAVFLLAIAPASMRLAITNREFTLWWPVFVAFGIASCITYLVFAGRMRLRIKRAAQNG